MLMTLCHAWNGIAAERAHEGLLDLSHWNFNQGDIALLQGDWDFYHNQLLSPSEVTKGQRTGTFPVPGTWNKALGTCCGEATYRLLITVGKVEPLGIEIPYMSTATKIFVNGQEFYASGEVGRSEEMSKPSRKSDTLLLPEAKTLEIVMQISNHHHARGGTWRAPRIGNFQQLQRDIRLSSFFEITLIGGIWSIGIYHLTLFFLRREMVTIAFSFCCFAVGLRLSTTGYRLMEYVFDHVSWSMMFRLEYLTLYVVPPLIWFYIQQMFPKDIKPAWLFWSVIVSFGFIASLLLDPFQFTGMINSFFFYSSVVSLFLFFVVLRAVYRRRTAAITIAVGACGIIVAAVMDLVNMLFFSEYQTFVFHLGFLFFTICQSFAIAQIYNKIFVNLKREEEMRRHSYDQLAKVFYPHQLQMMQSGKPLEETMPTGQGHACVLAFDIVGSSRIEHIDVKDFLENSIKRCLSVIDEGYDSEKMTAQGYRIKEVGDGFLCSVGYPFKTPGNQSVASAAVLLAFRFIELFQDEVHRFSYKEPIHCCVGVAYDTIEGYFPRSGTLEYDVYGRSIILANRYEGMRHILFPQGVSSSLMIVQTKVWMSLTPELQQMFESYDLAEAGIHVRDDNDVSTLYFVRIPLTILSAVSSSQKVG